MRVLLAGVDMSDFDQQCAQARSDGGDAARSERIAYDECPYTEQGDPLLRAMWQDGFIVGKLYGAS